MAQALDIVILAAGHGSRMHSRASKLLQPLAGRPLLAHVLDVAAALPEAKLHVVVGQDADAVRAAFPDYDIRWVTQASQRGTGDAVAAALPGLGEDSVVLVLYGDVPFLCVDTLERMVESAGQGPSSAVLLTAVVDNPRGYGRILRDSVDGVLRIVEERDTTPEQAGIREVNAGPMAIPAAWLRHYLPKLDISQTAQGEACLTVIVDWLARDGHQVMGVQPQSHVEMHGVNTRLQLAQAERLWQRRNADRLMNDGLLLIDPARFDLRGELVVGQDVCVDVNNVFEGRVSLGDNVTIGPNCLLRDVDIGPGCQVRANSVIDSATLAENVIVGPFAHIRPGSELAADVEIGNFVECNRSRVGAASKIKHLSYVGDSDIGKDVNIGAGVITCNYDGAKKHRTTIGAGAFIGSNAALVAPVTIGPAATVGAGSTITQDVPGAALAVGRGRQSNVKDWRPGSLRPPRR